jgi:hypothetical protein
MKELKQALKKFARALAQDIGFKGATAICAQPSTLNLTTRIAFSRASRDAKRGARENS